MRSVALLSRIALGASLLAGAAEPSSEGALRIDVRADERYAECIRRIRGGQPASGRACLVEVVQRFEGTTAGVAFLRARRGEPISRVGPVELDVLFGAPQAVLDVEAALVPVVSLGQVRF